MLEQICWGVVIVFVVGCVFVVWSCCVIAGRYDDAMEERRDRGYEQDDLDGLGGRPDYDGLSYDPEAEVGL